MSQSVTRTKLDEVWLAERILWHWEFLYFQVSDRFTRIELAKAIHEAKRELIRQRSLHHAA